MTENQVNAITTPRVRYIEAMTGLLRDILAAGSARDWDKMSELAKDLEQLANDGKGGKFSEDEGR